MLINWNNYTRRAETNALVCMKLGLYARDRATSIIFSLQAFLFANRVWNKIAGHPKARVVISCRDHIFDRLSGTGALGHLGAQKPLELRQLDPAEVRKKPSM